jgi:hypothetical protein
MTVLGERQRNELKERGATVVEGVVPLELVQAAREAIVSFLGIDPADARTFARVHADNDGIVPCHHADAFWAVRHHPALHQLYAELWGTEKLWVTMDRAGFRPPQGVAADDEITLHWDLDPGAEDFFYQGMLYLCDTPRERAPLLVGTQVYASLPAFLQAPPPGFRPPDSMVVRASKEQVLLLPGRAGDFVVWHSRAPHGPAANVSSEPRYTQYVSMYPVAIARETAAERSTLWRTKRPPPWWREGLVGLLDPEPGQPAPLSELGRKLVGLEAW